MDCWLFQSNLGSNFNLCSWGMRKKESRSMTIVLLLVVVVMLVAVGSVGVGGDGMLVCGCYGLRWYLAKRTNKQTKERDS